jgi:hypothetical protein
MNVRYSALPIHEAVQPLALSIIPAPGRGAMSALKHGGYIRSPSALVLRSRKVARLVRRMRAAMPWLEDADVPACRSWAELEIIGASLFTGIMKAGATIGSKKDGDVGARRLVEDHRKNQLAKLALERELGMTPLARSTLKVNRDNSALDLAAQCATIGDEADDTAPLKSPEAVSASSRNIPERKGDGR